MSLTVTGVHAIRYEATYDFLLVFRCNYASILRRLRYTYLPKFKDVA